MLSALRSLTHLSLSHTEFSSRNPGLSGAWQLHILDLGNNKLYGNLSKVPINLRTLSLSHNSLSGRVSRIGNLVNLKSLDLSYNRFTGSISHGILTLRKWFTFDVSVNRFTAIEVIKYAGGEIELREFDAQGNLFRGHLPMNFVTYGILNSINLARNQFLGKISTEYGAKLGNSWRSLFLDHNFLTGNLAPEFNIGTTRIRGSLANNCLSCPISFHCTVESKSRVHNALERMMAVEDHKLKQIGSIVRKTDPSI